MQKLLYFLQRYRHYLSLGLTSLLFLPVSKAANFYVNNSILLDDISYLACVFKWMFTTAWLIIIYAYILSIFDYLDGYDWFDSHHFRLASFFGFCVGAVPFWELIFYAVKFFLI